MKGRFMTRPNALFLITLFFISIFSVSAKSTKQKKITFTDDLNRTVSVGTVKNAAVLQGSLASAWILAGGTILAATSDCFSEPPEMTESQASEFNSTWKTNGFKAHKQGIFNYLGTDSKKIMDVGTMMNPNSEKIIASGADFVILSANIAGHKKLQKLLENVGIPCAFFNYDDFDSYLRILKLFTNINGRDDLFQKNGLAQKSLVQKITAESKNSPRILLLRASSGKVEAKSSESLAAGIMLKHLGCVNIADTNSFYAENLSMEKIIADDPDFIFVTTMGTNEAKALKAVDEHLKSNPAWNGLSAVKNGNYYVLPRELFHFKPGLRWAEAYQVLSKILNDAN